MSTVATESCLDENEAIELLLDPRGPTAGTARAHVDVCEACRALVAAVAKLVVDTGDEAADAVEATLGPHPGARLGAFEILRQIGRGAMGTVFLARDDRLGREVAVKLLGPELDDETALRRLRAEARSMARLHHPNVVEVLDVGRSEYGPFVAMQYVQGENLRDWSAVHPRSVAATLEVLRQAGRGLAAAHAAGVVHRDFKPANVLVGLDGLVRVADFGLARLRFPGQSDLGERPSSRSTPTVSDSTRTAVVGTPAYMAPEQLRGEVVGPAADQFAFCVTAFEALAGHRPFTEDSTAARLEAIEYERLESSRRKIPGRVLQTLRRGLKADPADRFDGMEAVLDGLQESRSGWTRGSLAAGMIAVVGVLATDSEQRTDRCEALESSPAFDEASRQRLRASWLDRGVSSETTQRLVGALERYASAWVEVRDRTCDGRPTAPSAIDVLQCLHSRRAEVEAFIAEARTASADHAEGFTRTVARLRSPTECEGGSIASTDPVLAEAASQLRRQYLSAQARGARDELQSLRSDLLSVVDRADVRGDIGVQAELSRILGVVETEGGDYPAAGRLLERAYFLAKAAELDALAFDAALDRSMVAANFEGKLELGRLWVRHARASLQLRPDDDERAVLLATQEGSLSLAASDLSAADTAFEQARARLGEGVPEHLAVSVHASIGQVRSMQRDRPGCRDAFGRALELARTDFGPGHPQLLRPLVGLATCEMEPDFYDDAQRHLEQAIAIAQRTGHVLGEAMARGNLGLLHRNRDRPTASLEHLAIADQRLREVYPQGHPELARSALNLAEAYFNAGRYREAADSATEARAALEMQEAKPETLVFASTLLGLEAAAWLDQKVSPKRIEILIERAPNDAYRKSAVIALLHALLEQGRHAEAVEAGAPLFADLQASPPAISMLRWAEGRGLYARALRSRGATEQSRRQLDAARRLAAQYAQDDPRGVGAWLQSL